MSNMKRVNIRVTNKVHEYFMTLSQETGVSMSALMYMALDQYIDNKKLYQSLNADVRGAEKK